MPGFMMKEMHAKEGTKGAAKGGLGEECHF